MLILLTLLFTLQTVTACVNKVETGETPSYNSKTAEPETVEMESEVTDYDRYEYNR